MSKITKPCPCGSAQPYEKCCGLYIEGHAPAPTAEALMRSRYTAYTLQREDYLLATWHASTRPEKLGLAEEVKTKWLGLQVKCHERTDNTHAIVEFEAKYKINGRAYRLQETSNFIRENGRWYYVDGQVNEK